MERTLYLSKRLDTQVTLLVLSLLVVSWLLAARLVDEFSVDEDFRTFYWMIKFQDPELFPNDLLRGSTYFTVSLPWGELPIYKNSPGYGLLYYLASFLVDPVTFSKLLPFVLVPLTALYLFSFGQAVRDRKSGILLAVGFVLLNLASPTSISMLTGLQRSFSCPLVVALVYYLYFRKRVQAAVVVVLCALIYAPVFLLAVATWSLLAVRIERRPRVRMSISARELVPLGIAIIVGLVALSPALAARLPALSTNEGDVHTSAASPSYEHLWEDPRYRAGGRSPLFDRFPFIGRGGLVNKGPDALHLAVLSAVGCLISVVRGRRALRLSRPVWCVLWASLILFALAWISIVVTDSFLLYLPSRYTRLGLFVFLAVFVFLNVPGAMGEAVVSVRRDRRVLYGLVGAGELVVLALVFLLPPERAAFRGVDCRWPLASAGLALGILGLLFIRRSPVPDHDSFRPKPSPAGMVLAGASLVVGVLGWAAYARQASQESFLDPSQAEREMLAFLSTLPKDTLLGGTPCVLDSVPLFAGRQVLFSCEKAHADSKVIAGALDAYYAEDGQVVSDFCRAHGVDYLVIDPAAYGDEFLAGGRIFFEPYNQEIYPRVVGRSDFALARVPKDLKMFQSGDWFVVSCDSLGRRE